MGGRDRVRGKEREGMADIKRVGKIDGVGESVSDFTMFQFCRPQSTHGSSTEDVRIGQ